MSGESGGTSRLNDDVVISQCDLVAEREAFALQAALGAIAMFSHISAMLYSEAIYRALPDLQGFHLSPLTSHLSPYSAAQLPNAQHLPCRQH